MNISFNYLKPLICRGSSGAEFVSHLEDIVLSGAT